ncbi:HI0074 family nucleotidyltransferase substrate-binding subunit [Sediminibacillus sp. JSM 1682029]|uniref:HI0074 family nucleotidyltransferase substrate-binding subunit n=1 Tax=Sediminibacillus sp. JSM 1682029 TaxID=3229857 RepID=UPI00041E95A9
MRLKEKAVDVVEKDTDKYDESLRLSYNHANRMLIHLKNIIDNYERLENPDDITLEVYRDSIIKKYEMLEDLLWKLLSKYFKSTGLNLNNPRSCYKQAFKEGLLVDVEVWDEILLSRNAASHVYNEEDYEKIKDNIVQKYVQAMEDFLHEFRERVF